MVLFMTRRRLALHGGAVLLEHTVKKPKQWVKPHLIILGRGAPEEKVLLGCKKTDGNGPFKHDHCHSSACKKTWDS